MNKTLIFIRNVTATVFVALFTLWLLVRVTEALAQEPLRCTDGTTYIFIRYPGMCPPGWWAE